MKIAETQTEPLKAQFPDGSVKTVRFRQRAFKLENDEDVKELLKEFSEGVDVTCVVGNYVMTKKPVEMKVQI